MYAIDSSLHAMGVAQYLLAFLFLASYALALGQFVGTRGRVYAVLAACASAVAFAARTEPWVHGVIVVAFALVAMGVFASAVWALWAVLGPSRKDGPARAAMPLRRVDARIDDGLRPPAKEPSDGARPDVAPLAPSARPADATQRS